MRFLRIFLFLLLVAFNGIYYCVYVIHNNKGTSDLLKKVDLTSNISASSVKSDNDNSTVVVSRDLFTYLIHSFNNSLPFPGVGVYISYTTALFGLKPVPNVKPILNEFGPVINDVTSFRYPIDTGDCILFSNNSKTNNLTSKSVFIAANSAPGNFERRDIIRKTWLNHLKVEHFHQHLVDFVGFRFFLGQTSDLDMELKIEKEANLHKDILQVDMIDDYYQMGKKDALLFNWIDTRCSGVDFILRVDDDVYVNIRNLATTLALQLSPFSNCIYGRRASILFPARGNLLFNFIVFENLIFLNAVNFNS